MLVSVCIPTLTARRLPYLREAVASARRQTHEAIEILVSDDGNDPPIRAFVEEMARLDPRVRYRRNDRRLGLGGNWNAVARAARGAYLVIIGDDDRLLPRFVESLLAARGDEAAVIFSNHHVIDQNGFRRDDITAWFTTTYGRDRLEAGPVADAPASVWRNAIPMSASLVRTADVVRLGIREELNTPEIELFARLAAEGKTFVFVPEFLGEYRVHPQSQTSAGLAVDRLIRYLDPIAVPHHVEPIKRALMAGFVTSAVTAALERGDVVTARELLRHRYYPPLLDRPKHVLLHRILTLAPGSAPRAIRAGAAARRLWRTAARKKSSCAG